MSSDELKLFIEYIQTHKPTIDGVVQPVTFEGLTSWKGWIHIGKSHISFKHDMISLDKAIEEYRDMVNLPGELDLIK
jgi:hypothetical protein